MLETILLFQNRLLLNLSRKNFNKKNVSDQTFTQNLYQNLKRHK
ncbi:hypothetical protein LEP1GSC074_1375 [Leptospira noguchii str. Hook]|uniref:Uncharacterized protein n=1 Tax=Leptospira noguchii serovar Autumnalis str. ZUN142 TaxID=1085540 RepID=M6UQD4_9LEPT|nr:hypothetical protein LEP1GSC186_1249 [Leptospira noguchii serovar Autumnalis str. ZUN142]EMS86619.1 hypothetical protein LEP1GSC074_1375 [Leptospira noguchii str. Hook]EMS87237.1 hypothetical protein LEP1GSC073_0494 [Leptospira noguchii str. Cascata]